MELVPSVHQVDGVGPVNVFLIAQPEGPILVDAGTVFTARRILRYIQRQGHAPADLQAVLVTHGDLDHIGGLHTIKRLTGAAVVAHEAEVPIVEGREQRRPTQPNLVQRIVAPLFSRLMSAKPTDVDRAVADGDSIFGLRVVHAPGHSPGSTCYLLEDKGVLFVGDALMNFDDRLSLPVKAYTTDMEQAVRSIKAIAQLDFDTCCFGHGPSIVGGAQAVLREFADRL